MPEKRITIPEITARKGTVPLVCLTAYTAPVASVLDPHVDILLVGDTLGMVVYGMESTLGVTVDMMVAHGKAVTRMAKHACVVVDMPFSSYELSPQSAYLNAARILQETGCAAVKLEGGVAMRDTIRFLVDRGIPVMGHVGLKPQHVHVMGGYRYQGRTGPQAKQVLADALAVQEAGAFAIVLECVTEPLAREITATLAIPTIGIGASPACDGQILVIDDMAGLTAGPLPRFVKKYADMRMELEKAAQAYAAEVKARTFPSEEYCYK